MHISIAALHRPVKPTGVCRHAANLACCLVDRPEITKISLIIGAWQEDYFRTAFALDSHKIKVITVNIKNTSIVRNLWFLLGFPKLIDDLAPDLVHLSFPFPFFKVKFKTPIVSTIHDLYPYEYPGNFGFPQVWFNRLFLKQCINNSDGLTCVSQVTLDKLKFYFPHRDRQQKTEVIYNYVNFENLQPQVHQNFSPDSSFLLSVAQHRQNKNLDLLIQAYSLLLNEKKINSTMQLVIVGASGPETENIKRLISDLDLENKVFLLSAIADAELCWLYQNCQVFIIASSTEGFCLPLVEALQFSDRVVCSDIPIFKEVGSSSCNYFSLGDNSFDNLSVAIVDSLNKSIQQSNNDLCSYSKCKVAKQYFHFYRNFS